MGRSLEMLSTEEELNRSGGEDFEQSVVGWPSATSFGSMFHRLVELDWRIQQLSKLNISISVLSG